MHPAEGNNAKLQTPNKFRYAIFYFKDTREAKFAMAARITFGFCPRFLLLNYFHSHQIIIS